MLINNAIIKIISDEGSNLRFYCNTHQPTNQQLHRSDNDNRKAPCSKAYETSEEIHVSKESSKKIRGSLFYKSHPISYPYLSSNTQHVQGSIFLTKVEQSCQELEEIECMDIGCTENNFLTQDLHVDVLFDEKEEKELDRSTAKNESSANEQDLHKKHQSQGVDRAQIPDDLHESYKLARKFSDLQEGQFDKILMPYNGESKPRRNRREIKASQVNSSVISQAKSQGHQLQNILLHRRLQTLLYLMSKTQETHGLIQIWDIMMGLKRSHSATMTKSMQSRRVISRKIFEPCGVGELREQHFSLSKKRSTKIHSKRIVPSHTLSM